MTLTFVPKILAMFMTLMVATPFMLATLVEFTQTLFLRIAGVDAG
jgi:flagellar biosynthetic protein FliQ